MSAKLKMLDDRILVELDESEAVSPGGILLPDTGKEKPTRGTVRAVGPGKMVPAMLDSLYRSGSVMPGAELDCYGKEVGARCRVPLTTKVGDRVLFARYGGYELPGNDRFMILREDDVLAIEDVQ